MIRRSRRTKRGRRGKGGVEGDGVGHVVVGVREEAEVAEGGEEAGGSRDRWRLVVQWIQKYPQCFHAGDYASISLPQSAFGRPRSEVQSAHGRPGHGHGEWRKQTSVEQLGE